MKYKLFLLLALAGVITLSYTGCKKAALITSTTQDVNIYGYLAQNPDKFSEYVKILDKTGYGEFLNAYGAYTAFAPDNDAIKLYLQETGKASIDAFTDNELKDLVRLHLIQDTINTNSFTDGKLPQITMLGQYLITGVNNKDGVSSYTVNRRANITLPNVHLANGNVHVIDRVLKAATLTVAKTIEANPEFSIFTQALKETGFYDSLNIVNNPDTTRRFLTVIAETNKDFKDSGITSYAQLRAKYAQTGNPKRADDSLFLYVAYHILTDARYIADIVSTASLPTLAPLNVITPKLDGTTVLLNDIDFNGKHEPGIVLDRTLSDITATNGVVHQANAHFTIKIRIPVRVDFDVADQPELRKVTGVFRKSITANNITSTGGGTSFAKGFFADITWSSSGSIAYCYSGPTSTQYYAWWGDYLRFPLGGTARNQWVEFRTPLLVKGRYKVWMCYYRAMASLNNPPHPERVRFNGEALERTFDFSAQKPVGTVGELESLGWKQYTEAATDNTTPDRNNVARLVGTINVPVTDRHTLRFEFLATTASGQELNYLDMIQFIPVNDNQLRPIFARDGRVIP